MDSRKAKDASPRWVKDVANLATRSYAVATASVRPLPDFLIAGTKRGGTTSLWNYLVRHPAVLPMFPGVRGRKSTDYFFGNDAHDQRWYRSHFHSRPYRSRLSRRLHQRVVSGEASPYYMMDPRICERIRAVAPDVKLIFLLRDPVLRAYSHYQERVGQGTEVLSFEQALAAEEPRLAGELPRMLTDPKYHSEAHDWYTYRSRGVYHSQLAPFLQAFPAVHVLVLPSEDLYRDPQPTFDVVCQFLGLNPLPLDSFERHNYIPISPMGAGVRRELEDFYAPHNEQLYAMVGRDYGWGR
jgi:hypothetical protein